MARVAAPADAGPQDLHRAQPQAVAGLDLGLGVVADDEHLFPGEAVCVDEFQEETAFPFAIRLVDRIDADRREERRNAERANLALLEAPETRGHEEALGRDRREAGKIGVSPHRPRDFEPGERVPPGLEHRRREAMPPGDPIKGMSPGIHESAIEHFGGQAAIVRGTDRLEGGLIKLPAHRVGGTQAVVEVEDDGGQWASGRES